MDTCISCKVTTVVSCMVGSGYLTQWLHSYHACPLIIIFTPKTSWLFWVTGKPGNRNRMGTGICTKKAAPAETTQDLGYLCK